MTTFHGRRSDAVAVGRAAQSSHLCVVSVSAWLVCGECVVSAWPLDFVRGVVAWGTKLSWRGPVLLLSFFL